MCRSFTVHPISDIMLVAILSLGFLMQVIEMAWAEMVVFILFQIYQAKAVFDLILMMHFIADHLIAHNKL
jgi:hypothetical protein